MTLPRFSGHKKPTKVHNQRGKNGDKKNNLDEYINRVGYRNLERNLNQAERGLSQATSAYNRLVNEKAQLERQVPQNKSRLIELSNSLQTNEARLVTIKERLAEELKDFDAKKAVIVARTKEVEKQIQAVKTNYMAYFK